MNLTRRLVPTVTVAGMVVLQISCGSDASGPPPHVPTTIAANSSTALSGSAGVAVSEPPSVVVRDESGELLSGAAVTFTVTAGGGTVTGGNATTNSAGIATVGSWTLGSAGTNTLDATTGSLPAVTFTANPCPPPATHIVGSTTNGELSVTDCKFIDDSFIDYYTVSIPTAGTYIFTEGSGVFDTFLSLETEAGDLVAVNNDIIRVVNVDSRFKVLLSPSTFIIGANSWYPGVTGAYTLTSALSTDPVTNCENAFVVRGISSPQSLQSSDCTLNGFYGDDYIIFLTAGQPVTVSMASTELDSYLEIHADGSSSILVSNDNIDTSTKDARVGFTPTITNFYIITARSASAGMTGAYTLSIQ